MVKIFVCVMLALLLAGCTQSGESSPTVSENPSTETPTESSSPAPLRPNDTGPPPTTTPGQVSKSAYISRIEMSSTRIEMTWSARDGAAEYRIHRIPLSDTKPDSQVMTADNQIHVASDGGRFVDTSVEAGAQYWYGVLVLDDEGAELAHGWHRGDAVTDTKPPGLAKDVQAVIEDGEVVVSWARPDENYELHSYRVLRGVDGQEPKQVSQTWNLDQTSFIDDDAPAVGNVTYAVVSMDFHWNLSEPTEVDIRLDG